MHKGALVTIAGSYDHVPDGEVLRRAPWGLVTDIRPRKIGNAPDANMVIVRWYGHDARWEYVEDMRVVGH